MVVRLSGVAKRDLDEIWLSLAKRNIAAAGEAVERLSAKIVTLSDHPFRGRLRPDLRPGIRSLTDGRYVILYRVADREAVVLRVLDGRRDIAALA